MTSNSMELQEQIPDDIDGNVRNVPDLILAIIATFGGVAVLLYSQTLPTHPGGAYGPGLFPSILGVLSAVFGVLLGTFVSFRMRRERVSQRSLSAGHSAEATKLIKKRWSSHANRFFDVGAALGAIAFYILLADKLGFVVAVTIIQIGLMIKFGHKVLWSIVIGVVSTVVLYWVFDRILLIQLPTGILG